MKRIIVFKLFLLVFSLPANASGDSYTYGSIMASLYIATHAIQSVFIKNTQTPQTTTTSWGASRVGHVNSLIQDTRAQYRSSEFYASRGDMSLPISGSVLRDLIEERNIRQLRRSLIMYFRMAIRQEIATLQEESSFPYADYRTFSDSIATLELSHHGECGEQARHLLLELLDNDIVDEAEIRLIAPMRSDFNHQFVVFRDESGVEFAADPFFDLLLPLDEFYTHPVVLHYFGSTPNSPRGHLRLNTIEQKKFKKDSSAVKAIRTSVKRIKKKMKKSEKLEEILKALKKVQKTEDADEIIMLVKKWMLLI